MSDQSTQFDEAVIREWMFKTPAMRDMTLAVCRLALARGIEGKFSALDLPLHGAEHHGGSGIAGSIFRELLRTGILAPVGVLLTDGAFFQERVRNAGGNPVGVWRIKNSGLARALIRVHSPNVRPQPKQEELVLA